MAVHTFRLEHLPLDQSVHVALFRDVRNGAALRQQLLAGNPEYEYAFVDASVIVSRVHALAAVFRAVNDFNHNRLKSRNVHSEIVFCLSPNNNIAESFRRFGVTDSTTNLLAVKVSTAPSITHESVQEHLSSVVEGTPVDFADSILQETADFARIKKVYKLINRAHGKKKEAAGDLQVVQAPGNDVKDLEIAILGAMALRGAG
ncbi:MAG: hypothetical protein M1824_003726 [Vezdaea acicularis]|nr:MAG: hypothetical protein M1824_003726 [Vezdaea acicularis]